MTYWPFWLGASALAAVALTHFFATGKLMSVSSRFTGLVERARGRPDPRGEAWPEHAGFLGGLVAGGAAAALSVGALEARVFEVGPRFAELFGGGEVVTAAVLFGGGALVGIGTRMSGGCTSGHGLCGVARLQPGSLVATASFFGAGVVASFVMGALL